MKFAIKATSKAKKIEVQSLINLIKLEIKNREAVEKIREEIRKMVKTW